MTEVAGLLGLGLRAGHLVVGVDGVRAALQRGQCHAVVLAADASPRAREKVERLAMARRVPLVRGPLAASLGSRLGRPPVMVAGVCDAALARGVLRAAGCDEA